MFYPDEIIREVCAQNDIVDIVGSYVPLRARGGRHWGLCPFHQENTPSFSVNGEEQFFHCFGCGAGGNVLTFVRRIEHLDFVDTLKKLADRVHFILPRPGDSHALTKKHKERTQIAEYNKQSARFYYDNLRAGTPEAMAARDYLQARGVTPRLQNLFGLGLAPPGWDGLLRHLTGANPDVTLVELHTAGLLARSHNHENRYYDRFRNRLMFPIIDPGKRVVGFGGRIMQESENEAKYLNSPETSLFNKSSQLYALHLARKARAREFIVVEGYMDVLALYKAGFTNTVGVLGTALTARHVELLARAGCETALLLLDSDAAGTAAAQKSIPLLVQGGLRVKVLQVPDAKDPDEFLQKYGADKLKQLLADAKSHVTFQINQIRNNYNMEKTDDRIRFTQEAATLLAPLPSEIETDAYVQETAQTAQIAPSAIFEEIKKQREIAQKSGKPPPITPRRIIIRTDDPGLHKARKNVLYLALTNPMIAPILCDHLSPEEMDNDVMAWLLSFAYQNMNNFDSNNLIPEKLISYFETEQDKNAVHDIFNKPDRYETLSDMEKAINDIIKKIKTANQQKKYYQLEGKEQENQADSMRLLQETLKNQYISLPNG